MLKHERIRVLLHSQSNRGRLLLNNAAFIRELENVKNEEMSMK